MDIELEVLPAALQCNNYETPKWGADKTHVFEGNIFVLVWVLWEVVVKMKLNVQEFY